MGNNKEKYGSTEITFGSVSDGVRLTSNVMAGNTVTGSTILDRWFLSIKQSGNDPNLIRLLRDVSDSINTYIYDLPRDDQVRLMDTIEYIAKYLSNNLLKESGSKIGRLHMLLDELTENIYTLKTTRPKAYEEISQNIISLKNFITATY